MERQEFKEEESNVGKLEGLSIYRRTLMESEYEWHTGNENVLCDTSFRQRVSYLDCKITEVRDGPDLEIVRTIPSVRIFAKTKLKLRNNEMTLVLNQKVQ